MYSSTVQALRLCTGCTAQRESRCIALLFHDHGTRRGWEVSVTPRPLFTPGKDPVPIVQEAGWVPGPVWTGTENLVDTGIRSQTVHPVAIRYTDWATRPTLGLDTRVQKHMVILRHVSAILTYVFNKEKFNNVYLCRRCAMVEWNYKH
jgi:hypothetical protein